MTFYGHQQDLAVIHATGISTGGNTVYTLSQGFQTTYEIQIETFEDLDSIDAMCSAHSDHSYTKVCTSISNIS